MHSTNYFNTLVEIAEDCPLNAGEMPPLRGNKKSIANLQFEMLWEHPYEFTSDEVFFTIHARRKEIPGWEMDDAREAFFSKGQPCFRASPLTKRYGWGIHSDDQGRVAMYSADSEMYRKLQDDPAVEKVRAMRSRRK
jgi:hypothetical protein